MKKINIVDWEPDTPQRCFAEFLAAWQNFDYDTMLDKCQEYWKYTTENAIVYLEYVFEHLTIEKVYYIDISPTNKGNGLNDDYVMDLVALVDIKMAGEKQKKKLFPRLIKEDKARPSEFGKWGVNPVTAYRTIKRKKGE